MSTANIETVAASLRSFSLTAAGGNSGDPSPPKVGEITVDLHSNSALPCHWEQHLDMQTGEIHYINRETGVKTTEDPRIAPAYSSDEYSCRSDYEEVEDDDDDDDGDSDSGDFSSSASSASPPNTSAPAHVLVAAGCKGCFMYFMVPKHVDACPKCGGGGLLHLSRNGCI
ncbi:uncharacterized protein LOC121978736 [Zingiber officinale]|uniref:uncharacterized protein LOC121978736 n=1 Tax=Zingiber officinale TaxID=94328 RepID=UPI001C4BF51C|nr:uncharacterized protein LOC121978736 [Zingiber officinale]